MTKCKSNVSTSHPEPRGPISTRSPGETLRPALHLRYTSTPPPVHLPLASRPASVSLGLTCSVWGDGAQLDGDRVSRLLEVQEGVVVPPRAVEIPPPTQHHPVRQVHPQVLLQVAHVATPATAAVREGEGERGRERERGQERKGETKTEKRFHRSDETVITPKKTVNTTSRPLLARK